MKAPPVVAALMENIKQGAQHPTLPSEWTSTVYEDEVGWVEESYTMVGRPTAQNPSAKWTNYTDGSCQRLIYVPNNVDATRYLLGCDAVPCCTEEQDGNHIGTKYNTHPPLPVSYGGKHTITLKQPKWRHYPSVEADVWSWKFSLRSTLRTLRGTGDKVTLHQWTVSVQGKNFTNTYLNYTAPTDARCVCKPVSRPRCARRPMSPRAAVACTRRANCRTNRTSLSNLRTNLRVRANVYLIYSHLCSDQYALSKCLSIQYRTEKSYR